MKERPASRSGGGALCWPARGTGGGHRIGCRENGPTAALPNALKRRMPRVRILYASPWGVFQRRVRHEPHQCPAGAAALCVLPLPSGSALPANSTLSADSPSHSRPYRPGWTDRPSGDSGTGRSHGPGHLSATVKHIENATKIPPIINAQGTG